MMKMGCLYVGISYQNCPREIRIITAKILEKYFMIPLELYWTGGDVCPIKFTQTIGFPSTWLLTTHHCLFYLLFYVEADIMIFR